MNVKEDLEGLARRVVEKLQREPFYLSGFVDYHGFEKQGFPEGWLDSLVAELGQTCVQAEIVRVRHDLTGAIHIHRQAYARCVILGTRTRVETPRDAYAFLRDHWFKVDEEMVVDVPPGTPHGFTVRDGGVLYFLSVQSPPIIGEEEDYAGVISVPLPSEI